MEDCACPTPGASPLAAYTGYLLRRAYARRRGFAAAEIPSPHTLRDVAVLDMLAAYGPLSQQDLGRRAGINRTLIGKLVTDLESRGLVSRWRNLHDRRATAIALTTAGRAALTTLRTAVDLADATLVANLTVAERQRLNGLLRAIVNHWSGSSGPAISESTGWLIDQAHVRLLAAAVEALRPLGLHPRHFGVLATLVAEQPCSQQHLARHLGISAPAVLEMVDALEAAGLLKRVRSALDRRLYDVTLTAAGVASLALAQAAAAGVQAEVAERLGADADAELRRLLHKLLEPVPSDQEPLDHEPPDQEPPVSSQHQAPASTAEIRRGCPPVISARVGNGDSPPPIG